MEGDSYYGVNYDDNLILNSVRNRKKVSENTNCPVCSCTIRNGELESHMTLEIERLQKLSSVGTKRKLSQSFAMPGSSTSVEFPEFVEESEIDVTGCPGSDVYQRVHANRLRRLRARSRRQSPPQNSTGECPVCNETLPVSRLQRHALRCLKRTGADLDEDVPDTSSEEGSIDVENDEPPAAGFGAEYEWCGETRVRASALQSPSARRSTASTVRRASSDMALVVDGDEDSELYGPPQYSPSRIAQENNAEETNNEVENHTQDLSNTQEITQEQPQAMQVDECRKPNGLVEASAETRIQALKARIKELELKQNSANETKCLICLGPYTSPAVSIQCWHVYCEVCWLESLRAKKICPHCNVITNVHHLRRIYM